MCVPTSKPCCLPAQENEAKHISHRMLFISAWGWCLSDSFFSPEGAGLFSQEMRMNLLLCQPWLTVTPQSPRAGDEAAGGAGTKLQLWERFWGLCRDGGTCKGFVVARNWVFSDKKIAKCPKFKYPKSSCTFKKFLLTLLPSPSGEMRLSSLCG